MKIVAVLLLAMVLLAFTKAKSAEKSSRMQSSHRAAFNKPDILDLYDTCRHGKNIPSWLMDPIHKCDISVMSCWRQETGKCTTQKEWAIFEALKRCCNYKADHGKCDKTWLPCQAVKYIKPIKPIKPTYDDRDIMYIYDSCGTKMPGSLMDPIHKCDIRVMDCWRGETGKCTTKKEWTIFDALNRCCTYKVDNGKCDKTWPLCEAVKHSKPIKPFDDKDILNIYHSCGTKMPSSLKDPIYKCDIRVMDCWSQETGKCTTQKEWSIFDALNRCCTYKVDNGKCDKTWPLCEAVKYIKPKPIKPAFDDKDIMSLYKDCDGKMPGKLMDPIYKCDIHVMSCWRQETGKCTQKNEWVIFDALDRCCLKAAQGKCYMNWLPCEGVKSYIKPSKPIEPIKKEEKGHIEIKPIKPSKKLN